MCEGCVSIVQGYKLIACMLFYVLLTGYKRSNSSWCCCCTLTSDIKETDRRVRRNSSWDLTSFESEVRVRQMIQGVGLLGLLVWLFQYFVNSLEAVLPFYIITSSQC